MIMRIMTTMEGLVSVERKSCVEVSGGYKGFLEIIGTAL